ncbi:MAG: hypothetical protein ACE5JX_18510 [Acidobacteriota bacterium]
MRRTLDGPRCRQMLSGHKEVAAKLVQLERRLADHNEKILVLIRAIRSLTSPEPVPEKRRIGFRAEE